MTMTTTSKKTYRGTLLLSAVFFFSLCNPHALFAITLEEKRSSLIAAAEPQDKDVDDALKEMNRELREKKSRLLKLHMETAELYSKALKENKDDKAIQELFKERLSLIEEANRDINALQDKWKQEAQQLTPQEDEGLWHQPDATIGQLVIDYASQDAVYLMPPEIANLKIHVSSQLTVPRAAWKEMLELILAGYGIGVKQLNPFVKQLFFLRLNQSGPETILDSVDKLKTVPLTSRVCYILTPPPTELKRVYQFLEKFVPQEQMNYQIIGSNIVIVASAKEILELMKIYDFISSPKQSHEYRIVALQKAQSEEVAQILHSIFEGEGFRPMIAQHQGNKHMPYYPQQDTSSGFRVIALKHPSQSLFLLGRHEQLEKASQIIQDIELRISEVQEKTVYWYPCKNSEAEDLAKVLSQVYAKMVQLPAAFGKGPQLIPGQLRRPKPTPEQPQSSEDVNPPLIVQPQAIAPTDITKSKAVEIHDNFIVDTKTNSIVMVVESYLLDKLKELIKKLDVPKKMVQLDVLLFEKKIRDNSNFGLNILKLGDAASRKHKTKVTWNHSNAEHHSDRSHHGKKGRHHKDHRDDRREERGIDHKGILHYAMSRHASHFLPAYDLAYNFLLAQNDVKINANPSVTTVNQTPAKIAIVEEISLNTGEVEIDTTKATRLKNSFTRAQFGITIQITPTIHSKVDDGQEHESKYITLATDVNFDTQTPSHDNRPDVTRRNVKNEVRIADGETVILGGLRHKTAREEKEMIPFLGELPGIGKLFGTTSLSDESTEMFIFVTPRIVPDPSDEYYAMRKQELEKRPGDIPEFLQEVQAAKGDYQRKLFEGSLKMLLGRSKDANDVARFP
jgi:general secretion pathway protein D